MFRPALACVLTLTACALLARSAPVVSSLLPQAEPAAKLPEPPQGASAEQLIERGDELRAEKLTTGALEYYRAALSKAPNSAPLHNRIGILEMDLANWKHSIQELKLAIRADPQYSEAYNNLGVVYYELNNFGKAIAYYKKALLIHPNDASYYSNMGAAYFSRKEYEKAADAYGRALQLDPDVLERTSRTGIAARLPSPQDRARFHYSMAKLYAKMGANDHSLEYLRRAIEDGYKHIDDVFKDKEFAALRNDPRFGQLMTKRPTALPE